MADPKPSLKVWPARGQLQKGNSKVLDIILENGATDYDVEIADATILEYNKSNKTLTSKADGGIKNGVVVKLTPKKDAVKGDAVSITVDVIDAAAAADKPVLYVAEGLEHEMTVGTEKAITITVQPSTATFEFVNEDANIVEYIQQGSKLKAKTTVTNGTNKDKRKIEFKAKISDQVKGDAVNVNVKTLAKPATNLTLSAEKGEVTIGTPVDVTVTTNAADFTVTSKNPDKATVAKGNGKFTITGVAEGTANIEVKATAANAAEATKTYVATVKAVAPAPKPSLTATPNNVTIKVDGTQVLTINLSNGATDYDVAINQQDKFTYDKNSKTITGKAVTTNGTLTLTPKKDSTLGDPVVVNVKVEAKDVPAPKPSLTVTPNPVAIKVEGKQVLDIALGNGADDFDFAVKNQDKFDFDKAKKEITAKAEGQGAILELTPKKGSILGDKVNVTVNIAAKDSVQPDPTTLTINPENGDVKVGKTLDVTVTTNATDFTVESKNVDKATVVKGQGKFTVTGVAKGEAVIEVKATAAGASEVVKQFRANVTEEVILPPEPGTAFTVNPQVVTIVNKTEQVFEITNEGTLKVECEPADAIAWDSGKKSITAKRTGQFAVKFIKDDSEVIVVNLTVSPEPSVWDKYQNLTDVRQLLDDGGVAPKDKFDQLDNSVGQYGSLVQSLSGYNAKMHPTVPTILPKNGAGQNYNLFNQIMYVVELSDKADFTAQFDIINLYFKEYKNESYNEHLMQRFDNYWIWDAKALTTWTNLVTCICILCDIDTRAENLKKISLDKVLDPTTTIFSATAIANIKSYYNP